MIDNEEFMGTIYVLPDSSMTINAIIGNDIFSLAEVKMDANGFSINNNITAIFLSMINTLESNVLDIGDHLSQKHKEKVESMILNYD